MDTSKSATPTLHPVISIHKETTLHTNVSIGKKTDSDSLESLPVRMPTVGLSVYCCRFRTLSNITIIILTNKITAPICPSWCGESTLLRSFKPMNDLIPVFKVDGQALSNGENIYSLDFEVVDIRQRVGMVFQRPNPFPMSIYDNIAYGSRLYGIRKRQILDEIVEQSLRQIAIWEDVRDKVNQSALDLSGGQQQRLRAP